ncbi:MAG: TetR/AcrR family transcriptional regulator, partial [Conexibacteraceae bacterium]|nr:TetR/AcrR family transcriptional regulator [Conexibacteraceae bacterium]
MNPTETAPQNIPPDVAADTAPEAAAGPEPTYLPAGAVPGAPSGPAGAAPGRAMRADAKRNYDKIVAAAREAFAETGASTSLEAVARRAGVGIGTLYRHFPTRQALLEAVYVGELQELCGATRELLELPPWESFVAFAQTLAGYLATKKALAAELMNYIDPGSSFFKHCRGDLFVAGEPLLKRAQEAGAVRADVEFVEIVHLVGGVAKIEGLAPEQREHLLDITLDGLRARG